MQNNTPYVVSYYVTNSYNCLDTDFMTPNPWLGQTYLVVPGGSNTARIFRKDGHGCDGKQGVFNIQPTFIINGQLSTGDVQPFDFDSHGSIEMTPGVSVNYGSQLAQPGGAGGGATWTISVPP
jgi:hypothetical protein